MYFNYMENLERYIRKHEGSLDGVINRKLDRFDLSNNFITSRIVPNFSQTIRNDDGNNKQSSIQYKYHSNRPQRIQNRVSSNSCVGVNNGKSAPLKGASSTPISNNATATPSNHHSTTEVVSPLTSFGSIEKQLEDFSFRLNSLKMKRSLQIHQLHQLILTDIAIEETSRYENETDNAIHQADEEYNHFLSMGDHTLHVVKSMGSSLSEITEPAEFPSTTWSPHSSGRIVAMQNLLRELDAEKNRSAKSKSLDDLLGYQTD